MTMEAPSTDNQTQQGVLNVRDFTVHDEAQLQRAVNQRAAQAQRNAIDFSGMRVEFTRMPGQASRCVKASCADRCSAAPSTASSTTDATKCTCAARLVPLYGPNNLLGQIPVVGLFMGGEKEGLVRYHL